MRHPAPLLSALATLTLLGGCFHATIETGAPPSLEVHEAAFASAWVYGLVPPKTISTAARCQSGVAKVETRLSFVNQLVGFLTFGIYTPMHIKVTCAARGAENEEDALVIRSTADTPEARAQALANAVHASIETGREVTVAW